MKTRGSRRSIPLAVTRRLGARERSELARYLAALVRWSATLTRWPPPPRAPDAIPFVSLYVRGRLVGCQGSDERTPRERIARAFLRALHDARFRLEGGTSHADLSAQLTYVRSPSVWKVAEASQRLVPGIHGVGLAPEPGSAPVILLPQVASDGALDAPAMIRTLFAKARRDLDDTAEIVLFEAEDVSSSSPRRSSAPFSATRAAASWLSRVVRSDGHVTFLVDARSRSAMDRGPFHHGRAAVVVRALATSGADAAATRARDRLERDVRRALRGSARVDAWPDRPSEIAGTLALAILAGVDVAGDLRAFARAHREAIADVPWHAAQVVHALGHDAPSQLFDACRADLARAPFAPWTLLAARSVGDARVVERATKALHASIRSEEPARGGVGGAPYEVAMAALAMEALAEDPAKTSVRAVARLRAFLLDRQLAPGRIPAALDPELAVGAFPLSTAHDRLRSDVTGHALSALEAAEHPRSGRRGS